jgi:hypothetical protein
MRPDPGHPVSVVLPAGIWRDLAEFLTSTSRQEPARRDALTLALAAIEDALQEATSAEAQRD